MILHSFFVALTALEQALSLLGWGWCDQTEIPSTCLQHWISSYGVSGFNVTLELEVLGQALDQVWQKLGHDPDGAGLKKGTFFVEKKNQSLSLRPLRSSWGFCDKTEMPSTWGARLGFRSGLVKAWAWSWMILYSFFCCFDSFGAGLKKKPHFV